MKDYNFSNFKAVSLDKEWMKASHLLEFSHLAEFPNRAIFLTGIAGTGKSSTIDRLTDSAGPPDIAVKLALTGVAARNIDGRKIHSCLHFPVNLVFWDDKEFFRNQRFHRDDVEYLSMAHTILIDEISTVSSAMLDCMDKTLRVVCNWNEPFAGKNVVFVGDPFDMPPWLNSEEKEKILKKYKSEFFFDANVWKELDPIFIELTKGVRKHDENYSSALDNIRKGKNLMRAVDLINQKCYQPDLEIGMACNSNSIILTLKNDEAETINDQMLKEIKGEEFVFGDDRKAEFSKFGTMAPPSLRLKIGAKVMFTANHPESLYKNGELGVVRKIENESIEVEKEDRKLISVTKITLKLYKSLNLCTREKRKKVRYREVYAYDSFTHFPLRLAWAIGVHKSQGLTFNNVTVWNERKNPFKYFSVYSALSRCRSFNGLKLLNPLSTSDVKVNSNAVDFFEQASNRPDQEYCIHKVLSFNILKQLPEEFNEAQVKEVAKKNGYKDWDAYSPTCVDELLMSNAIVRIGEDHFQKMKKKKRILSQEEGPIDSAA
jgi:hypothetical protein